MDNAGAVADQLVNQSLKASEEVAKLMGWGAEKLAGLLYMLWLKNKDIFKNTALEDIMNDNIAPAFFQVENQHLKQFMDEAKDLKVKPFAVGDKDGDMVEVVVAGKHTRVINHILEKMGYAERYDPEIFNMKGVLGDDEKNLDPLVPLKSELSEQGNISKQNKTTAISSDDLPSVVEKVETIKVSLSAKNNNKEDLER